MQCNRLTSVKKITELEKIGDSFIIEEVNKRAWDKII